MNHENQTYTVGLSDPSAASQTGRLSLNWVLGMKIPQKQFDVFSFLFSQV